jgi:hypothetical protein
MRFETALGQGRTTQEETLNGTRFFAAAEALRQKTLRELPKNRDLLDKIKAFGLQTV